MLFIEFSEKVKERDAINDAAKNKEYNEKIMSLIHKKEQETLESLSKEELEAMLR